MLSRDKIIEHLTKNCDDTNSDKDRFIKDMLILMEFGNFDFDESDEKNETDDAYA